MSDHEFDETPETDGPAKSSVRRQLLLGSGALLAGGALGRTSSPRAASAQGAEAAAPELPWPWKTIDPMEAGSRTYDAYLNQGG